jgi:DNA-binding response OmpR family regulator
MSFMSQIKNRVLVVDDEPSICHSVRMILIYAGYEVNTAWSSKEALAILENEPHDLVVTDFNMPGMKGDELSEVIKTRWPETAVVMLTASAVNLRAAAVPLPFVDALLAKPFGIAELGTTVRQLLAGKEQRKAVSTQAESVVAA